MYGKTSSEEHKKFVGEFHRELYQSKYIYEKSAPQAYCETCGRILIDRFVVGRCPACGADARGDQCDACGAVLEPETLADPKCSVCGNTPVTRTGKHLYIAITALEKELKSLVDNHPEWRKNAVAFSNRYINEGLRDRAVTRDLDWGIDVPHDGYEDKKIYIWAENVLGYLSMSYEVALLRGDSYEELWGENAKHYYVHGKDNIPFHTIILPSLLLAHGGKWRLPDEIISSEYLTLEGRKISTSSNWAIWETSAFACANTGCSASASTRGAVTIASGSTSAGPASGSASTSRASVADVTGTNPASKRNRSRSCEIAAAGS
jgi:methionyl-tRNA synthetase